MNAWAAVVGWPVAHSLSPRIFRAFRTAMDRPLFYRALSVKPELLESTLLAAAKGGWVGWNVTLPHKVTALELMDRVDATAQEAGAVNAVRFLKGKSIGYNTDADGFLMPLARRGVELKGRRCVVLGAGGAARAVCASLLRVRVAEILVFNRTASKARALASAFGGRVGDWDVYNRRKAAAEADLVVNATSIGMDGKSSPLPTLTSFKPGALAYDLVYRPLETPFLKEARESGVMAMGGVGMLVAQAEATWRIWFDEELPDGLLAEVEAELVGILAAEQRKKREGRL